jgi:hypothetical protein
MINGLATTFRVLSKTPNDSAVNILLPALDSVEQLIQDEALAALLVRRNPAGHSEILRRIPSLSQRWCSIIRKHAGRLTGAMRNAVLGSEENLSTNAFHAAVMFSDYDLIPTLLTTLSDAPKPKADLATESLMQLIALLYNEISHPGDQNTRHDIHQVHKRVVTCLEASVQRFGRHKRREVIEGFLLLVDCHNVVLKLILDNPHHVSYLVLIDILSRNSHNGIIKLILDYYDNPQAPSSVLNVAANRCDLKFIRAFLNKIRHGIPSAVRQNLKRMASIAWLKNCKNIATNLDDAGQLSMVQLAMASGIARPQAYNVIEYFLQHGKPVGRREAAIALDNFNGAEANQLALKVLDDPDPQVVASVLPQLRRRGIPGILTRLVEMLDNPHLEVRHAARVSLAEFSFPRFIGSFELLDDDVRQSTAALVKKIDQQTVPLLRDELQSPVRSRRLRGLQITRIMDIAHCVEDLLIKMLHDEDHIVRTEAAVTLGKCRSPEALEALEEAIHDTSLTVQEAAKRSFNEQS